MVRIVKGSEQYSKSFKMKAVDPDAVLFRFLPQKTNPMVVHRFVQRQIAEIEAELSDDSQ